MNKMGRGTVLSNTLNAISTGVRFDVGGVYLTAPQIRLWWHGISSRGISVSENIV
jgi:hypothetical protein